MNVPDQQLIRGPRPVAPDEVRRLAAQHGLGELLAVRPEVSPAQGLVVGGGMAGAALAGMVLVAALVGAPSVLSAWYSVVRVVMFTLLSGFLFGLAFAGRAVVAGPRVHYLHAGGLVHRHRAAQRAVAWPDVAALEGVYDRRTQGRQGRVVGYRVRTQDGWSFVVPLVLVEGRDAFIDRIVSALRVHGRPVR
jgi:hypothetical protein